MSDVLAWHFLPEDRHTRFKPRTLVTAGQTLTHSGALMLCRSGYHASVRAIDALLHAPGPIICRVRLHGEQVDGGDKITAQHRTVLWMADATEALHEMACCCAETALLIANVDDARCWEAIEAKRAWRRGEITTVQLAAARDAAGAAACGAAAAIAAAYGAATDALWDLAMAAARETAAAASRVAAWAVRAAVRAGAMAAARDEQNTLLEMLLNELEPK